MIQFFLLISRQGKVRLSKWYNAIENKERDRTTRDVIGMILSRPSHGMCNFLEFRDKRVVYKRYASLYVAMSVDLKDNELIALEMIQHYVEILDQYFGNVCELDLIFNFDKAYQILDELVIAGELQEPSKRAVLKNMADQDLAENPELAALAGGDLAAGGSSANTMEALHRAGFI